MRARYAVALLFLLCLWCATIAAPPAPLAAQTDVRQQVIELTNQIRMAHALPPLKRNDNLQAAADWITQDNAGQNTLSHTDSLGRTIGQRFPAFGYNNYSLIAENLAAGYATPEVVVEEWMTSPGHRDNILRSGLCEIGAGYTYRSDSYYQRYWSQTFGCRWATYPVVINGEAAITESPNVQLYIYGSGWAQQMRLSNDGINWTEWRPYQSSYPWTLLDGSGERTVLVEIRNGATVYRNSDTIILQSAAPLITGPHRLFVPLVVR
ncbi:CAP domain-containing protein [Chloroflexus aggregans]|uniref:SCP-like extracellular n=1 Tax=Chloroflexus aggregans (strain MD-66 / DSM 9485) TaxID=326427 RepID=B8G5V0_CHLAD|nr:CAP domain-containing protein [Chloroflexus aggregans]ACL23811.1 SCP-like extracellular [Chloroflexus aggregans DSM 9485]